MECRTVSKLLRAGESFYSQVLRDMTHKIQGRSREPFDLARELFLPRFGQKTARRHLRPDEANGGRMDWQQDKIAGHLHLWNKKVSIMT